jgi:hypothetical protein
MVILPNLKGYSIIRKSVRRVSERIMLEQKVLVTSSRSSGLL